VLVHGLSVGSTSHYGVELEYSYGAGDGQTRSGVVSMPKERSGRPGLDWSCNWEKYGYDRSHTISYIQVSELKEMGFKYGEITAMKDVIRQWIAQD